MITNNGLKILLNRTYKATPDYEEISTFKVGTSQATPAVTDTDLTLPIPIYNTEQADNCETVGNWAETTDGTDSLNSTTYKEGAGSLNLIKAATTADNVTYYNDGNMASLDFTSKDLWLWIYFKDAATLLKLATTDALEIRYGNDYDTNFWYKKYDNADLVAGWNYFKLDTTTMTETGSVTLNACDSGAIKLTFTATSDTIAAGDVITDSINTSNVAWEDNSALMIEADKRYGTTASQIDVLKNNFSAVSIELGDIFLPAINDVLAVMRGDLGRTWIDDAGDQIQLFIDAIGEALRKFGNLLLLVSTGGVFGEGGAVDKIKGFFGGGRASGGPVSGGTPYVVGEKGPELFVPQGSGSIVPNDQMGGGATTINFNNATVRNDSDLDSIISAVKQSLNRDLSIEQLGI